MQERCLIPLLGVALLGWQTRAIAHGVTLEYQMTQALEIQAAYDSGEPMAEAQVTVYAPAAPATPWLQGTTDQQGRFVFVPDGTQPGTWEVKVRQAGHGDIVSIPIQAGTDQLAFRTTASETTAGYTPLQKGLMGAAVIWGFVGTALFFAKRK